jgi:lysophospholipase L1-like esterase
MTLRLLVIFLLLPLTCMAAPVRIMPLGDSITEGGGTFSVYRYPLLQKLQAAGHSVEYVGSKKSNSPAGPLFHEGYGGRNAEFLATIIGKNFKEHPADIVLLHAGHNHFAEEKPVDKIVAAQEKIIATVRELNPKVIFLVAQVIPSGKLPKYSYIPDLNAAIAKMVARLHTPEQPVIVVNMADGFDPATDTIADQVHPNAKGAEKMAGKWFEALDPVLKKWAPAKAK